MTNYTDIIGKREIEYRAIASQSYETNVDSIDKGEFVYGFYYYCRHRHSGIIVSILASESGGVGSGVVQVEIEVDCNTVCQYTGLCDKNGTKIFQGDIVRIHNLETTWKYGEPKTDWRVFCIKHNEYTWAFNNRFMYMPLSTYHDSRDGFYDYVIEVIGNVFQNPELYPELTTN